MLARAALRGRLLSSAARAASAFAPDAAPPLDDSARVDAEVRRVMAEAPFDRAAPVDWDQAVATRRWPVKSILEPAEARVAEVLGGIRGMLRSRHPVLDRVASYYFAGGGGKHLRPAMLVLLAQSLDLSDEAAACRGEDTARRQLEFAGLAETIHVASLIHDDVLDNATTRRDLEAINVRCV